jgi:hypothetical protein
MMPRSSLANAVLLITITLSTGCASRVEPPTVHEILARPGNSLTVGENINLAVDASGAGLRFEWTALRGRLSNPNQAAVQYTAPDTPGIDTVTVKVTYEGGEIIRSITVEILSLPDPTATLTPLPADTPTPVPEPIACNSPAVTKNLFPQLSEVSGQTSFYGPLEELGYVCEAVYDIVHTQSLAIHIMYENMGENVGWWGIGTPEGYDAVSYDQICFWAYAQQPNQAFRLKMKDTTGTENGVITILEPANEWTEICTDLNAFADLGIELNSLENINLGFEQPTGSAEIWVADFEFR